MVCVDDRATIGDANAEMEERVVMQDIAVRHEQYEVQVEVGSNERGVTVGPFPGPGSKQPGIEPNAVRERGDPNAAVKLLTGESLGNVDQ